VRRRGIVLVLLVTWWRRLLAQLAVDLHSGRGSGGSASGVGVGVGVGVGGAGDDGRAFDGSDDDVGIFSDKGSILIGNRVRPLFHGGVSLRRRRGDGCLLSGSREVDGLLPLASDDKSDDGDDNDDAEHAVHRPRQRVTRVAERKSQPFFYGRQLSSRHRRVRFFDFHSILGRIRSPSVDFVFSFSNSDA